MKKIDFTAGQIEKILAEARLTTVNAAARKNDITEATIYAWAGKYGRLGAEEIRRLRHLKNEHARRKTNVSKVEMPKQ